MSVPDFNKRAVREAIVMPSVTGIIPKWGVFVSITDEGKIVTPMAGILCLLMY
jgi:hypothetical protein